MKQTNEALAVRLAANLSAIAILSALPGPARAEVKDRSSFEDAPPRPSSVVTVNLIEEPTAADTRVRLRISGNAESGIGPNRSEKVTLEVRLPNTTLVGPDTPPFPSGFDCKTPAPDLLECQFSPIGQFSLDVITSPVGLGFEGTALAKLDDSGEWREVAVDTRPLIVTTTIDHAADWLVGGKTFPATIHVAVAARYPEFVALSAPKVTVTVSGSQAKVSALGAGGASAATCTDDGTQCSSTISQDIAIGATVDVPVSVSGCEPSVVVGVAVAGTAKAAASDAGLGPAPVTSTTADAFELAPGCSPSAAPAVTAEDARSILPLLPRSADDIRFDAGGFGSISIFNGTAHAVALDSIDFRLSSLTVGGRVVAGASFASAILQLVVSNFKDSVTFWTLGRWRADSGTPDGDRVSISLSHPGAEGAGRVIEPGRSAQLYLGCALLTQPDLAQALPVGPSGPEIGWVAGAMMALLLVRLPRRLRWAVGLGALGVLACSDTQESTVGADTVTSDADAKWALVAELRLEELRFTDLTGVPLTVPVPKARYEIKAH